MILPNMVLLNVIFLLLCIAFSSLDIKIRFISMGSVPVSVKARPKVLMVSEYVLMVSEYEF